MLWKFKMDKQALQSNPVLLWLRFIVRMSLFALALLWPAGTWLYSAKIRAHGF